MAFTLIKDLLLQTLIVIFPVLIFQVFIIKNSGLKKSWSLEKIICLFCISTAIVSMTFPVRIEDGFIFDFHIIPLVIALAYGGVMPGIITFLAILAYRFIVTAFIVEGDFLIITLTNGLFVLIFSYIFIKKYKKSNKVTKLSYYTGLVYMSSIINVLGILYLILSLDKSVEEYLIIFIFFPSISVITIWICIHIIENMKEKLWMEKEIQRAERLNVIGHLAASVAHEIRNPMTVVKGFMQLFNKEAFVPDDKKAYLKLMIEELDRAETIINDYLTLAKPRKDQTENVDVEKQIYLVKDIISSYASLNNGSIILKLEHDLFVRGNPEKLNQVLINLIKNAIEASPEAGEVIITSYHEMGQVVIDISDQGIGLTSEEVKQLGTAFYSTKDQGTGLGLMVCYGIIESMDGKIEVRSKKNQGTTFTIKIPAV